MQLHPLRYVIEGEALLSNSRIETGSFYYKLVDGVFKVTSVTSKSLFDEIPPDLWKSVVSRYNKSTFRNPKS